VKHTPPETRTSRNGDTTLQAADGTVGYPALGLTFLSTGTAVIDAPTSIGPETAAKLAVVECIASIAAFDVQPTDFWRTVARDEVPKPAPRIELRERSIQINWPEAGVDHAPLKITVTDGDAGYAYEPLGLMGPDYLDDTEDKFGRGTVLIHESDVTGTVVIEALLASQTARDAVELALSRIFAMEPSDLRPGRRVMLKSYYDQPVRLFLATVPFSTSDRPEQVQSNDYPLYCYLDVDLPSVRLVRSPGRMQESDLPRV